MLLNRWINNTYSCLVGEALYTKLLWLKCSAKWYKDALMPCLGGLHVSLNYLGVMRRQMGASGLSELWIVWYSGSQCYCSVLGFSMCKIIVTRWIYCEWWHVNPSLQWVHSGKLPRMAGVLSVWQGCSDARRNVNKSWCLLTDQASTA